MKGKVKKLPVELFHDRIFVKLKDPPPEGPELV
jgi:hypothetical protein